MARRVILAFLLLAATSALDAGVNTYPPFIGSPPYPVPIPVESTEPVEGFRTRSSLEARLLDLSLTHDFVSRHLIGTSLEGTSIHAYRLSDGDDLNPEGLRESGVLINGTIHAREWASPEIVTQLIEHLAAGYGTDPIGTYLIDTHRIVMIPVLNTDGFDQAQRFPNQDDGGRDGRRRRKNMRGVDHSLTSSADNRLGVDVNRNLSVGFGGGSGSATDISYRGQSAFSEPEAQALQSVTSLFESTSQLRFFADVHGAIPGLYTVFHGTPAADRTTRLLAEKLGQIYADQQGRSIGNGFHRPVCPADDDPCEEALLLQPNTFYIDPPIGATDEFHGFTYSIPSFTIEYPTPNYRDFGSGWTFILPDDEVTEVVTENREAILFAFYYAAGPPILESVRIWDAAEPFDGQQSCATGWVDGWVPETPGGDMRTRPTCIKPYLAAGRTYRILLQFNKPMRRDEEGTAIHWPGVPIDMQPEAQVVDGESVITTITPVGQGWLPEPMDDATPGYFRYAHDAWLGEFTIPADTPFSEPDLSVSVLDLYGFQLDEDPGFVADWDDGWQMYVNTGAPDTNFRITIEAAPFDGWSVP